MLVQIRGSQRLGQKTQTNFRWLILFSRVAMSLVCGQHTKTGVKSGHASFSSIGFDQWMALYLKQLWCSHLVSLMSKTYFGIQWMPSGNNDSNVVFNTRYHLKKSNLESNVWHYLLNDWMSTFIIIWPFHLILHWLLNCCRSWQFNGFIMLCWLWTIALVVTNIYVSCIYYEIAKPQHTFLLQEFGCLNMSFYLYYIMDLYIATSTTLAFEPSAVSLWVWSPKYIYIFSNSFYQKKFF